ncbi:hypothetical protein MferCBS31731_007868 [Microsporum ferrugineum]
MTSSNDDGQSNGKFEGYVFKSWLDTAVVVDEKFYGMLYPRKGASLDLGLKHPHSIRNTTQTLLVSSHSYSTVYPFVKRCGVAKIREKWISEQEEKMRLHGAILENPTPPTPEDERRAKEERMAAERDKARLAWEKYKAIKKQKKRKAAELSSSSTQTLPNPRKRQMPS